MSDAQEPSADIANATAQRGLGRFTERRKAKRVTAKKRKRTSAKVKARQYRKDHGKKLMAALSKLTGNPLEEIKREWLPPYVTKAGVVRTSLRAGERL